MVRILTNGERTEVLGLAVEAVPVDMAPSSRETRSFRAASGSGRRDNAMNAVNPYQEFRYEIVIAGES
jgi:hypothetical protein